MLKLEDKRCIIIIKGDYFLPPVDVGNPRVTRQILRDAHPKLLFKLGDFYVQQHQICFTPPRSFCTCVEVWRDDFDRITVKQVARWILLSSF
jgi:hypothetical protein